MTTIYRHKRQSLARFLPRSITPGRTVLRRYGAWGCGESALAALPAPCRRPEAAYTCFFRAPGVSAPGLYRRVPSARFLVLSQKCVAVVAPTTRSMHGRPNGPESPRAEAARFSIAQGALASSYGVVHNEWSISVRDIYPSAALFSGLRCQEFSRTPRLSSS